MMRLWRIAYFLFHGLDTRIRVELEEGRFSYPIGTLPRYQREGIERLLLEANIQSAIIALKRHGVVATYGIDDAGVAQKIRNISCT